MPSKERVQDGWLVIVRDTECFWERTVDRALERGRSEVEDRDRADGSCELGECAGSFEVVRAYRVDFRPAALLAASTAMDALSDGTLETNFVEDHDLIARMERELARAFSADIDRVCGPWYEALGTDKVEVVVDRIGEDDDRDDYVIAGFSGSLAMLEEWDREGALGEDWSSTGG